METIVAVVGLYFVYRLMRATLPARFEVEPMARQISRKEFRAAARKYR